MQDSARQVLPVRKNDLMISCAMVIDFLKDYLILSKPADSKRTFERLDHILRDDPLPLDTFDTHTMYVCHEDKLLGLMENYPGAFAVSLCKQQHIPETLKPYQNRLILIYQKDRFSYFSFLLQQYFMKILVWTNELDSIIAREGTLEELLEKGISVIPNFIALCDDTSNLIAYSQSITPPDDMYSYLVDVGCLPPNLIEKRNSSDLKEGFMEVLSSKDSPYEILHYPIYINHSYYASIIMVCHEMPLSESLIDLFKVMIKRIVILCETLWTQNIRLMNPHYFFFENLLKNKHMDNERIQTQLALTAIPPQGQLKLMIFSFEGNERFPLFPLVANAATRINQGNCYCFSYFNDLVVLCYAENGDSQLSHKKSAQDVMRLLYKPYGIVGGCSQIFEDITELDLAYTQAKMALYLKESIDDEFLLRGLSEEKPLYWFEDALMYYLVDPAEKDPRFLNFSLSHSILEKILAEDEKNDTNDLILFWLYLRHERSASSVAERLNVHRNTVVYHIEKIENRFDLDLSSSTVREKMLIDFKVFFLCSHNGSIKNILQKIRALDQT